jgi:hypothetical protein
MQLGAVVFIIPWKALYMFRVLFTPIIRSDLKLYMQLLVQSCCKVRRYCQANVLCHTSNLGCIGIDRFNVTVV